MDDLAVAVPDGAETLALIGQVLGSGGAGDSRETGRECRRFLRVGPFRDG